MAKKLNTGVNIKFTWSFIKAEDSFHEAQSSDLYNEEKQQMIEVELDGLKKIVPDFSKHIKYIDTFTPATIARFTRHLDGAVYGSPRKIGSGDIGVKDVYICGTDQGYLGIVGSLLSGILMANRHALI